jgi:hypothetical protein
MQRFPIKLGRFSRPVLVFFGVRQSNAYVDLIDELLDAHFGFFRMRVPIANIKRWEIQGPWLWIKAIGVRRGARDGDISFDGTHTGGVRIDFHERVHWGFLRVPRLYVTVADLEGFSRSLAAAGVPGEDVRSETSRREAAVP